MGADDAARVRAMLSSKEVNIFTLLVPYDGYIRHQMIISVAV